MRLAARLAVLLTLAATVVRAQNGTFAPPPNVTLDGVPPIPAAVADAVSPYAQWRQARVVAWHPTERRLLIATAFSTNQIHEVRFPAGDRRQLTFFRDGMSERPAAAFEPSGHAFVFQRDASGGGEAVQLYRYEYASASTTLLTDGKSRNGFPAMSRKSGLVAYDSTRRDGKNRDIYVLNPSDPKSGRLVAQLEGQWTALDWAPDEQSILAIQIISNTERYIWRINVADGQKTRLTEPGKPVRWTAAQFGPDGKTVYALGNLSSEQARLFRYDGSAWTRVTGPDDVVESFSLAPDGKLLAVVFTRGAASHLQLLDPSGKVKVNAGLPPGNIRDLLWHANSSEVAFSMNGARSFHDVFTLNAAKGRPERWTWSEMNAVDPESLPDAELIQWKSFDGLTIPGWLYRPPARFTGPRPVIVNIHGGPDEQERPRALGRSNYFRNDLGIAIIYPNVRGSLGYGRTYQDADNGLNRQDPVKDIGALLDWIATQGGLDKTRVMLAGPSYGGYLALSAAIAYPDRVRAVNPVFAVTDILGFLESTDISRRSNRNQEYGDPADPKVREYLSRTSPLTNAARLKAPVLMVAGARDTTVPIAQTESMVKALKDNGTPVWYIRIENVGHMELPGPVNDFSVYTWVYFVQKYLIN
jgi:dipeptidyl aminopeptidase/acylaminoacyl peptidase